MPNTEFLEKYGLYRKFEFELPSYYHEIKDVNINMYCPNCEETRTFRFSHKFLHNKYPQLEFSFSKSLPEQLAAMPYKHRTLHP